MQDVNLSGVNVIKTFFHLSLMLWNNKLGCLSEASLYSLVDGTEHFKKSLNIVCVHHIPHSTIFSLLTIQ